jgi:hypothetical protein
MSLAPVAALIIFFVPIVAFVQTLVALEKLQGFRWIGTLLGLPFIPRVCTHSSLRCYGMHLGPLWPTRVQTRSHCDIVA